MLVKYPQGLRLFPARHSLPRVINLRPLIGQLSMTATTEQSFQEATDPCRLSPSTKMHLRHLRWAIFSLGNFGRHLAAACYFLASFPVFFFCSRHVLALANYTNLHTKHTKPKSTSVANRICLYFNYLVRSSNSYTQWLVVGFAPQPFLSILSAVSPLNRGCDL